MAETETRMTEGVTYCARHPQVETGLLCGRCGTPICPRCLVQTPVGARCPTCANVRRIPTVDVKPVYVVRALGAALAVGVVAGAFWGYATQGTRGFLGLFLIFIAMGLGYVVGEAVSIATNRKRGQSLQAVAVVGVIVAYFTHNLVGGLGLLPSGDFWGYIAVAIAAVYAASRLNP
jgi:hypothetical protein